MGGGCRLGKVNVSYTKNPESDFFYKESKSNKKNSGSREGTGGGVARVSYFIYFFFQKNPSLKKKFAFFFRG